MLIDRLGVTLDVVRSYMLPEWSPHDVTPQHLSGDSIRRIQEAYPWWYSGINGNRIRSSTTYRDPWDARLNYTDATPRDIIEPLHDVTPDEVSAWMKALMSGAVDETVDREYDSGRFHHQLQDSRGAGEPTFLYWLHEMAGWRVMGHTPEVAARFVSANQQMYVSPLLVWNARLR